MACRIRVAAAAAASSVARAPSARRLTNYKAAVRSSLSLSLSIYIYIYRFDSSISVLSQGNQNRQGQQAPPGTKMADQSSARCQGSLTEPLLGAKK